MRAAFFCGASRHPCRFTLAKLPPPKGPLIMRFHPLLGTALLVGCTGGALATTSTQTTPAAAPDALECVRQQLKKVGFVQTSYDTDELRVAARKFDASATR